MTRAASIRVALVGGPMYDPLYNAIPSFARDAGLTVDIVAQLPHPELNTFVKEAFESGADLDLISTHTKYAPSQATWLSSLEDDLPRDVIDDLLPRPAELSRIDGELLQVPRNLDVRLLHYRTDVIGQPPRSWIELIEVASSVRGLYGFLFPGRDSGLFGTFYELLVSAGGDLFDDNLAPAFDSTAGRWALEQIVELHLKRRVTPRGLASWHYDEISAAFRDGDAAMVTDWPGSYHLYRDPSSCRVADRIGLALLPLGPANVRAAYAGCHSFAIPRAAGNREGAVALLHHLTSFEAQLTEARRGAIPCRASALAAIRAEAAPDAAADRRWQLLAATEPTMIIPPRFAAYPQCEDALWRSVQRAMLGEWSAAEALQRAAADVHAIVDKPQMTQISSVPTARFVT
jgi:multiple sugar transport system substrate-binding protein